MKTIHFSTLVSAPKEKIWKILWEDETYRKWTSVFNAGSYAVSDWKEGSKVLFLSPEGEGMHSIIDKMTPNQFMSFKHIGIVKDGKEQPETEESKSWSGAKENYTLKDKGKDTELLVDMDITEEHETYFKDVFPEALKIVKNLAEK